jgi:hypothetical protein
MAVSFRVDVSVQAPVRLNPRRRTAHSVNLQRMF